MQKPLWFTAVVFGGFVATALAFGFRRRSGGSSLVPTPVVLDSANDKSISVSGWTEPQLQQIRRQFVLQYTMSDRWLFTRLSGRDDRWRITFPDDLTPEQFFFLVNYLVYPEELSLADREVGVVGRCTLTEAFAPPDPALIGAALTVYVPQGDEEYDQVYLRVSMGPVFRCTFSGPSWQPVTDARFPSQAVMTGQQPT